MGERLRRETPHRGRRTLAALVAACAVALLAAPAPAQDGDDGEPSASEDRAPDADVLTSEDHHRINAAVRGGLDYLASRQGSNGAIGTQYPVASTSLAGLAFLGGGSTYNSGPHARNVQAVTRYLTDRVAFKTRLVSVRSGNRTLKGEGYFFTDGTDSGRMHGHGFATLFLAEVYGTLPREHPQTEVVREKLRGAILLSLASQTRHGGWGYRYEGEPTHGADEASVTVTQIQALRAARNAGLEIPVGAIDQAVEYVRKCMSDDGTCRYSLHNGQQGGTYELTAAAVSSLNASGVYDSEQLKNGMAFLKRCQVAEKNPAKAADRYYYYGNFYASQAMWQAGPELFDPWFDQVHQHILESVGHKRRDLKTGLEHWVWRSSQYGDEYATSMALLILEIPLQYLPIYQR